MTDTSGGFQAPSRCFCQIAISELVHWAKKKYLDEVPTIQLLEMAKDREEKEAVSIVALLDLPDEEVVRMLTPLTQSGCNILACRDHVREWLTDILDFEG